MDRIDAARICATCGYTETAVLIGPKKLRWSEDLEALMAQCVRDTGMSGDCPHFKGSKVRFAPQE